MCKPIEGNAFAQLYYHDRLGNLGRYLDDYVDAFAGNIGSLYHVAGTLENLDKMAPLMTAHSKKRRVQQRRK
jgi:hypothetical protein